MTGTLYILPNTSNPGRFYYPNRDVPDAGNLEATLTDPGSAWAPEGKPNRVRQLGLLSLRRQRSLTPTSSTG